MGSTGNKANTAFLGGGIAPSTAPGPLAPNVTIPPVNQGNPNVQTQAPNDQNTPVDPQSLKKIAAMSDDELAALVNASKQAQMPNYLADVNDPTQRFVFQAGLNEKPMVLDTAEFTKFMADNNIPNGQIIARSVNSIRYTNQQGYATNLTAQQVQDILKYSKLTYIGGKHGGQMLGAGAYFAMTGGSATGYGQNTAVAVLNPNTAKVISDSSLDSKASAFAAAHPKFARAVGRYTNKTKSIYALAMGYNVIAERSGRRSNSGDYYNIIDRSALVYRK